MSKPILIFLHVPKTGGTTVRQALLASTSVLQVPVFAKETSVESYVQKLNNQQVVLGHLSYGTHKYINQSYEYLTVLRHPACRVFSDFDYTKRTVSQRIPHISAPYVKGTVRDFVSSAPVAQNICTRQLCGKDMLSTDELTEEDFQLALSNLKTFKYIGITNRLGALWKTLKNDYGFKANIGHALRGKSYTLDKINKGDIDCIVKYNQHDIRLYEYAEKHGIV